MTDRKHHIVFASAAVIVGLLLGLNETRNHGYVVAYSIIGVFLLAALIGVVSIALLVPRRCRSFGVSGLIVAVALFSSFYATIAAANAMGAWDRPMVRVGPDVPANIVVLFQEGATAKAIFDFATNVVATPHPGGGSQHLPGMQSLLAVRVGSHDGYAVGLRPDITSAQRRYIDQRISSSPIVSRTFENVAPEEIILPGRPAAN